jgi:hypothetical protein
MYGDAVTTINISGLNPRLFPAPLPLVDSLHSSPAGYATKALQRTSPLRRESFIAPRTVTRVPEKNVPE